MGKLNKILRIKQVKSEIGYKPKAKATLAALGLKKMQQVVEHQDSPQIRGMIKKVNFLINVTEVNG